jgi:hypothetical protein
MPLIASCHCGATKIELAQLPTNAHECNCSLCSRTGGIWGTVQPEDMRFLAKEADKVYSASQGMNQHHFCSTCGIHTWGDAPDWASVYNSDGTPKPGFDTNTVPSERSYMVNMRLIDDLDWPKIQIEKMDGRNNW